MKKEILSEINRMKEIMGQKNIISEGSIPGEILQAFVGSEKKILSKANAIFKKSYRKLEDMSENELKQVLRTAGFEQLERTLLRKIDDMIGIYPQDFAQKSASDLLDLASQKGVSSEFAPDWIKWYQKEHNVAFKGGSTPSGGSGYNPITRTSISQSLDDIMQSLDADPGLASLFNKKKGAREQAEKWVQAQIARGGTYDDIMKYIIHLERQLMNYPDKKQAVDSAMKLMKAGEKLGGSYKGALAWAVFVAVLGMVADWWTGKDVLTWVGTKLGFIKKTTGDAGTSGTSGSAGTSVNKTKKTADDY
jgi:hypothetical protein